MPLLLSASLPLPSLSILIILSFSSVNSVGSLPGSANDVDDAVLVRYIPPQAIIFPFLLSSPGVSLQLALI